MHIYESPLPYNTLLINVTAAKYWLWLSFKNCINKTAFKDSDLLKYIPFPVPLIRKLFIIQTSTLLYSLPPHLLQICSISLFRVASYAFVPTLNPSFFLIILVWSETSKKVLSLWEKFASGAQLAAGSHYWDCFIVSEDLYTNCSLILTPALLRRLSFPMKTWPGIAECCTWDLWRIRLKLLLCHKLGHSGLGI